MNNLILKFLFPSKSRALKEAVICLLIQILVFVNNNSLYARKTIETGPAVTPAISILPMDILAHSQISYRADGGFTGVQSFSVLISCVDGQISFLKSIHDPRSEEANSTLRQIGSLGKDEYLTLWDILLKCRVFNIPNAPDPKTDLLDEFTYTFDVSVGSENHQFRIYAMSRPGGSSVFRHQERDG